MITQEDAYQIALSHVPDGVRSEIETGKNLFKAEMACMVAAIMEAAKEATATGIEVGAAVEREICAGIVERVALGQPKAADALYSVAKSIRMRGESDPDRIKHKIRSAL